MFVRTKSTPNSPRKTVQIVESVRDGDKVRQKIVRYVGVAMDDKELKKLLELAEYIKSKIEYERTSTLFSPEEMARMTIESRARKEEEEAIPVNLRELKEEQRVITGIHKIYGKIYSELGFESIFTKSEQNTVRILYNIVMALIANPSSKRMSVMQLERDFGVSIPLQKVYRMMDKLDEAKSQAIQDCAFQATNSLLKGKIDVIFIVIFFFKVSLPVQNGTL
jgi:hypothetical protein